MKKILIWLLGAILLPGNLPGQEVSEPYLLVLGVAQDGGYPHIGCEKECCQRAWEHPEMRHYVVSLALVDPLSSSWWLFEATPDITEQLHFFREWTGGKYSRQPTGIFVSHAHIGHYTGLMYLGREAWNSKDIPVFGLPGMVRFLETNGPWSQLTGLGNIRLHPLTPDSALVLNERIRVTAFRVPHREEYSETAGFRISAGDRSFLFIPDIDKWERWERDIVSEVKRVDAAILDGTFLSAGELPGRRMEEVPHPFVPETVDLFRDQPHSTRQRIVFIHFNHTNPLMWDPPSRTGLEMEGFRVARERMIIH